MHNDISEILFSEQDLAIRVRELGEAITRDYADVAGDAGIVVVSILRGGAVFTCDLIRAIDLPLEVDFMAVSSYGNGAKSSGVVRILKDLSTDIRGRHVVIAEDIIDTGRTLNDVIKLLKARNPLSLKVITLLDKPERRLVKLDADISLFTIPDHFVIGYGLDCGEIYRNLPYIAEYDEGETK